MLTGSYLRQYYGTVILTRSWLWYSSSQVNIDNVASLLTTLMLTNIT